MSHRPPLPHPCRSRLPRQKNCAGHNLKHQTLPATTDLREEVLQTNVHHSLRSLSRPRVSTTRRLAVRRRDPIRTLGKKGFSLQDASPSLHQELVAKGGCMGVPSCLAYLPPSHTSASAVSPPVPKRCATAPSWGGDNRMSNVLCRAAFSSVGVMHFTWISNGALQREEEIER